MKTIDGTRLYHDAIRRIQQLERYNAELAAQIDRLTPVVDAAQVLSRSLRRHDPASWLGTEESLERVVIVYEQQMAALAKGTGG